MEAGEAAAYIKVHQVRSDREWQKSSGLTRECRDVPEVQGIPIPKQPRVRWDRLLQTLMAFLLVISPLIFRGHLKERQFISADKIAVDASNCHILVQDGDSAGLRVQHWMFMGTVEQRCPRALCALQLPCNHGCHLGFDAA